MPGPGPGSGFKAGWRGRQLALPISPRRRRRRGGRGSMAVCRQQRGPETSPSRPGLGGCSDSDSAGARHGRRRRGPGRGPPGAGSGHSQSKGSARPSLSAVACHGVESPRRGTSRRAGPAAFGSWSMHAGEAAAGVKGTRGVTRRDAACARRGADSGARGAARRVKSRAIASSREGVRCAGSLSCWIPDWQHQGAVEGGAQTEVVNPSYQYHVDP